MNFSLSVFAGAFITLFVISLPLLADEFKDFVRSPTFQYHGRDALILSFVVAVFSFAGAAMCLQGLR